MSPPMDRSSRKKSADDFIFGKLIGDGSFSTVYLAKEVASGKEFAIKVLEKTHVTRQKKIESVMKEKEVLRILSTSCKFFVHLYWTFQDAERLYFVLTYAKNGELLKHIHNLGCFNIECTRFYTAEIVLALEYLHSKGIIHRDLKPENILFDENWHILITDFGSAKLLQEDDNVKTSDVTNNAETSNARTRRKSFVGTAQYVSPEMLTDTASTFASDLWALGCVVYQMVSGSMPFRGGSEYQIFQKILKLDYEYPEGFDHSARDFVEKLLVIVPSMRLGACHTSPPYTSIRDHELFKELTWESLGDPPKLSDHCDNVMEHFIPDHLEPGLDGEKMSKLHLDLLSPSTTPTPSRKKSEPNRKITDLSDGEIQERLTAQQDNLYNAFVEGNLILKQGLIDKKKGLFARRRMFLLTLGPHIYYVDPVTMTLKGEIPWSEELKTEAKNFKLFFVHTPNRKYYLEDPDSYALEWCKAIDEVKDFYYPEQSQTK